MLLQGSAEYITQTKEAAFFDLFPLSHIDEVFPRGKPRILNTHFSLDVLPQEFKGRKTVIGICLIIFMSNLTFGIITIMLTPNS